MSKWFIRINIIFGWTFPVLCNRDIQPCNMKGQSKICMNLHSIISSVFRVSNHVSRPCTVAMRVFTSELYALCLSGCVWELHMLAPWIHGYGSAWLSNQWGDAAGMTNRCVNDWHAAHLRPSSTSGLISFTLGKREHLSERKSKMLSRKLDRVLSVGRGGNMDAC